MIINNGNKDIIIEELKRSNINIYLSSNDRISHLGFVYIGLYINKLFQQNHLEHQVIGIYDVLSIHENNIIEDIPIIIGYPSDVMDFAREHHIDLDSEYYRDINLLSRTTLIKYNQDNSVTFSHGIFEGKSIIFIAVIPCMPLKNIHHKSLAFICAMLTRFVAGKNVKKLSNYAKEVLALNSGTELCDYITTDSGINWEELAKKIIFSQMRNTFVAAQEKRKQETQNQINSYMMTLRELTDEYNKIIEELNGLYDADIDVEDVQQQIDFLYEFINNNKSIARFKFEGPYMFYDIVTELNNYDEDIYYTHMTERNIQYWCPQNAKLWKKLFDQIFIERKYKIMVSKQCAIKFDKIPSLYTNGSSYIDNYMLNGPRALIADNPHTIPSPHAGYLNCEGTYRPLFNEALKNNDIILAINYTIAWVANINWADSAAPHYLINGLLENIDCIKDSDGNYHKAYDLINSLREE